MPTSFLVELQKPEVRKRFDSRPLETRKLIAGVAFDREVKSKFDKNLTTEELGQLKQKFVERYTGAKDTGPLPKDFGVRKPDVIPTGKDALAAAQGGVMRGAQNITSVAGMLPNPVSEFAGQAAESYEKGAEPFRKEHPWAAGGSEFLGQSVPAIPLEVGAAAVKGGVILKSAAGMLPYSKTGTEWLVGTGIGVGLGAVWNKFFGPKGIKVAESTVRRGLFAKKPIVDTIQDAERRGVAAELDIVEPDLTMAQIYKKYPHAVAKINEKHNALSAAKREAAATAAKSAKGLQATEKEALKAQEKAGKATEGFIKRFGHDPSPVQLEGLKAGGAKLAAVLEGEQLLQTQLKQARNLLTAKRLQIIRKGTGKIPGESEISQVRDAIKTMSIDDINNELASYKKIVKPPVATTPTVEKKVEIPTVQQQTETKLAEDVNIQELGKTRPDVAKAVEQTEALAQPPETSKPREPFSVKVGSKDLVVLSEEEARGPDAVKIALERIRISAQEHMKEVTDERKQAPVVNKAVKLIEFIKAHADDFKERGLSVFDDLGKPMSKAGKKIGRPTKIEAAIVPPEQRAIETAEREAAALQEKRNEANYAKASGKEISVSNISASGEARTSPTGGAGRLSSFDEFEKVYGRPAEAGEAFMLESGHSPAEAVDEAVQEAFESSQAKLFEQNETVRVNKKLSNDPSFIVGTSKNVAQYKKKYPNADSTEILRSGVVRVIDKDNKVIAWITPEQPGK